MGKNFTFVHIKSQYLDIQAPSSIGFESWRGWGLIPKILLSNKKKINKNSRIPKSCKFDEFMRKILSIIQ